MTAWVSVRPQGVREARLVVKIVDATRHIPWFGESWREFRIATL